MFFGLNLIFNGVVSVPKLSEIVPRRIHTYTDMNSQLNFQMWSLFTTALRRGTSTTQVSIMNTSANFILTAFMGSLVFSETLPPLWWLGATFLVVGNVIIGRKDESKDGGQEGAGAGDGYAPVPREEGDREQGAAARKDDEDEDVIDLGDLSEERR